MWWSVSSAPLTYETVGLMLGLLSLLAIGCWWRWACDLIDAYPEAFGFPDERAPCPDREFDSGVARYFERN
jgi:hypothetical protein